MAVTSVSHTCLLIKLLVGRICNSMAAALVPFFKPEELIFSKMDATLAPFFSLKITLLSSVLDATLPLIFKPENNLAFSVMDATLPNFSSLKIT